jgi:hypothetical protein
MDCSAEKTMSGQMILNESRYTIAHAVRFKAQNLEIGRSAGQDMNHSIQFLDVLGSSYRAAAILKRHVVAANGSRPKIAHGCRIASG